MQPPTDGEDRSIPSTDGGSGSDPGRGRALGTLFLVVFLDLVGFGVLIPVIPLYALAFGADEFVGGLLIASYSLMQFLAAPVLGRLSDERGRRPVLLLSLSGSVLAWTLFGVAGELGPALGTGGLVVLFGARMLAGAMGGNLSAAQAYVADVTPPEERARGLGVLGAAFGLGFVFGPAIGGGLSSGVVLDAARELLPAVIPVSEFTLPSFGAALLSFLGASVAVVWLPEPDRPDAGVGSEAAGRSRTGVLLEALRTSSLRALVVAFFLASLAFSAFESQFVFLTDDLLSYGTTENAVLLTYVGVVIAVVQGGLVGPLTDRFGEGRLAVVGAAIQVVTLAAVPFAPELTLPAVSLPVAGTVAGGGVALALAATPLALGNALTNVSLNALVSRDASAGTQGGAFGLTQSAGSLARTVGPGLAGALYVGVGYWSPFVAAGLLFVPVVVLLGTVHFSAPTAAEA